MSWVVEHQRDRKKTPFSFKWQQKLWPDYLGFGLFVFGLCQCCVLSLAHVGDGDLCVKYLMAWCGEWGHQWPLPGCWGLLSACSGAVQGVNQELVTCRGVWSSWGTALVCRSASSHLSGRVKMSQSSYWLIFHLFDFPPWQSGRHCARISAAQHRVGMRLQHFAAKWCSIGFVLIHSKYLFLNILFLCEQGKKNWRIVLNINFQWCS